MEKPEWLIESLVAALAGILIFGWRNLQNRIHELETWRHRVDTDLAVLKEMQK